MEWEFSPEDVVKARVGYELANFRHDLAAEVQRNVDGDASRHERVFNLLYDMCHALATDKDFEQFLGAFAYDPPTVQFLKDLRPAMEDNVAMLGAILQRMIMDGVEAGMPLDKALDEAAARHLEVVRSS